MQGYVENITNGIEFAFGKHIQPKQRVGLKEIYDIVGYKKGFGFDEAFVNWLKSAYGPSNKWNIVVIQSKQPAIMAKEDGKNNEAKKPVDDSKKGEPIKYTAEARLVEVSDKPLSFVDPSFIAKAPLRKARTMLKDLNSKKELEHLLSLLDGVEGKDSLRSLVSNKLKRIS